MCKVFGSKILRAIMALALVVGLVCAMALPVMAKDNGNSKSETVNKVQLNTIKGKVDSKTNRNTFIIVDNNNNQTVVTVDNNTKYYLVQAAPFASTIKAKVQDKIQNFKNNQQENNQGNMPNNMNQRGLGDKSGLPATTVASNDNQDDELDLAMENEDLERGLIGNEQGPQGFFDKIKSWFGGWPKFGQKASFADLEVGDGVIARIMPNETLAKQVLIIKPSNIKKVSGIVEAVADDSFTVNSETGDKVNLTFNLDTRVTLKGAIAITEGQWATVVYKARDKDNLAVLVDVLLQKPIPKTSTTSERMK
jgi:hypothetical protein